MENNIPITPYGRCPTCESYYAVKSHVGKRRNEVKCRDCGCNYISLRGCEAFRFGDKIEKEKNN